LVLATGVRADQPEPQRIVDVEARPINEEAAAVGAPLRWKSKPLTTAADYYASESSAQAIGNESPPLRAGWNITRIDPNVRPAQAVSDPFNDPFGDRKASAREPELILQPTQAEAGIETLPPPRMMAPLRRGAPASPLLTVAQPGGAPGGAGAAGGASAPGAPAPGGTGTLPPPASMSPMPGTGQVVQPFGAPLGEQPSIPCERTYNDRNCCELEVNCHAFRDRLLADSIRNISLDITPRFNPDLPREEDLTDRLDKLARLEVRQWRNRRGQLIGTGRMLLLENNTVVLADGNGQPGQRISLPELGEDELCYVNAWWRLPAECPLGGLRTVSRNWMPASFVFHASTLCHKPLYFEEVQLERYGHTAGPLRQPIISGAHFFLNIAALPYNMAINPPTECQYALGYYRPGNCAPWMIPPIPLSVRGASAEVLTALGLVYLIP
jgi:hypothetical protein